MSDTSKFSWVEVMLALSVVALVLQIFPGLLAALDFRTWPWFVWSGIFLVVIGILVLVREYHNQSS
jgi:predicted membrane channel-forming protein YqfA (hemolysin III family)